METHEVLGHCRQLNDNAGWKEWMVPLMRTRMAGIQDELVDIALDEQATLKLRVEHSILAEWARKPETVLKSIITQAAERGR